MSSSGLSPVKQALVALEQMRAKVEGLERARTEPIAIVGMACRVPGAPDAEYFWTLLENGRDAVSEVPKSRWDVDALYDQDPDKAGKIATRRGGFLDRIDEFDPEFFGISPRETLAMDPQQRLLLEVAWEALENAGQSPAHLAASPTGVFIGITGDEFAQMFHKAGEVNRFDMYFASGIARSVAAGRISYVLGLHGPSLSIDTACSSSLVAVHSACLHLRAGECRTALAGGVNIILSPEITMAFSRAHMLAPDGRCKTFDASADGFVRAEGCGVVVLKRLSDALADRDNILAVIRGSAVNQDGRSSGLTVPNGPAQESVIRQALENARAQPTDIDYIEAHGTGTALGDPIEAHALAAVFTAGRDASNPLVIGSVKTNLGHLESAAGVTGLIKIVLSLQKQHIPPHLHFQTMNPHIDWKGLPVEIPVNGKGWKKAAKPRMAGVSSFGFSGTNVHIVVEEAPAPQHREPIAPERGVHVLALSARSGSSLETLAKSYAPLVKDSGIEPGDICYTANTGRTHFAERAVYLGTSREELHAKLLEGACLRGRTQSRDSLRIAFLFSGQGAQYAGMGRDLYETEPVFRTAIDRCAALLEADLKPSLLDVLYGDAACLLDDTRYTQPALFAVEYALAELWRSWGVEPTAVFGHSVGEYAAACVAGFCSLEDAISLIAGRGQLMGDLPKDEGSMAAILAPQDQVEAAVVAVGDAVSIAAINGPENIVISGRAAEVDQVAANFAAAGVRVEHLRVSHAFHSALMAPIEQEFAHCAAQVEFRSPRISLISSVTGRLAKASHLQDSSYWRRQVREPVHFREAMETLASQRYDIFIEIGPGSTLLGMGKACIEGAQQSWVPSIRRAKGDNQQLAESIAALYVRGVEIDWNGYEEGRGRRRVALPTYPFERQRYWIDDLRPAQRSLVATGTHPLLGNKINVAGDPNTTLWQSEISLRSHPWITDHRVHGIAIVPMTAFLEMLTVASGGAVSGVIIREPLLMPEENSLELQVVIKQNVAEVYSREGDGWKLHASCNRANSQAPIAPVDLASLRSTLSGGKDTGAFYSDLKDRGHDFGPSFRLVGEIITGPGEALGEIDASAQAFSGYKLHPVILDACVQTIAAAIDSSNHDSYLPVGAGHFEIVSTPVPEKLWAHATIDQGPEVLTAQIHVLDGEERMVACIRDLELRRMTANALARFRSSSAPDVFFAPAWERAASDIPLGDIATTVRSEAPAAIEQHGMTVYPAFRDQMDRACAQATMNALDIMGTRIHPGLRFRAADLAKSCGVLDRHAMLFDRLLEILLEDGCLQHHDGLWDCVRVCQKTPVDWHALENRFPAFTNEIRITARCADNLSQVLTGAADELQLLFPGGDTESAERLYSESPSARAFNQLLSRAAASAIPATGKLKILEIGAGTGGTSAFVLPQLPADRTSYVFSDISPLFTARANGRFTAFPFVAYATLDIERDPLKQSFGAGEYDAVIAANVVHATADLATTLRHVRSLLKPGGLLVLLEVTRKERWIDLTFGMTEGWWRFTDRDLRPSYALIGPAQWKDLLERSGFADTQAIEAGDESLNAILLAKKSVPEARLTGEWLVAGHSNLVPNLAPALRQAGAQCTIAGHDLRGVLERGTWTGIVFVAPAGNEQAACEPVLEIVHALGDGTTKLLLVTTGAQPAGTTTVVDPAQSVLWGLGRTIASESSGVKVTCIDLDPAEPASCADALVREAASSDCEGEVAYRSGVRYVNRVQPVRLNDSASRVRLSANQRGVIDNLRIEPAERRAPGAGQVEIEVDIAGIGFRDVLNMLDMYPGDPGPLGAECAGRIAALGAGVEGFSIGDEVIAIAPGAHDGYVLANAELVARRPGTLPIEDAMTLPVPYLTALYALDHLGCIRAGERVLVHSGAGGVGMAAIRVAQRAGAELFATAGTQEKRELLRSIGVPHVMSSRSTEFANEIARLTEGRGVDLILNSLAGDTIDASFTCLARGGRFLEIGKSGIWDRQRVAALGKDISYHVIDWSEELHGNASLIGGLLRRIVGETASGGFQPLPRTIFDFRDAHSAYRYMAQARHTGRILLRQRSATKIRNDRTYLITGGLSGIGLLTAEYLAGKGARHLVLTGRRAPSSEAAQRIAQLQQKSVAVKIAAADVGERSDMGLLLRDIAASMPAIGGVVHSAGTLDDAVLGEQSWKRFESVFRSKVRGSWNLHELTAGAQLDFFLLYSSIASVLGAPGQANHAAASAFEDALAWARRNQGLPATSINWGAWKGTGSADRLEYERRRERIGLHAFDSRQGIELLDRVLRANPVQIGVAQLDWKRYAEGHFIPKSLDPMIESAVSSQPTKAAAAATAAPATPALLDDLAAAPEASRMRVLRHYVHSLAMRILGLAEGQKIDRRKPLHELGLDSLMAVEFRNGLSTAIGRPLPVTLLFSYPAIDDITGYLAAELLAVPVEQPVEETTSVLDAVEELSDEEVDRLLAARMGERA